MYEAAPPAHELRGRIGLGRTGLDDSGDPLEKLAPGFFEDLVCPDFPDLDKPLPATATSLLGSS